MIYLKRTFKIVSDCCNQ